MHNSVFGCDAVLINYLSTCIYLSVCLSIYLSNPDCFMYSPIHINNSTVSLRFPWGESLWSQMPSQISHHIALSNDPVFNNNHKTTVSLLPQNKTLQQWYCKHCSLKKCFFTCTNYPRSVKVLGHTTMDCWNSWTVVKQ